MARIDWAFAAFAFLLPLYAQSQSVNKLPIKRVVLYKNGVGYFEHLGRVQDNQAVTIPFTSAQLNDVLKSLTVLDLNGGRITGVEYGSSAPVERQLGDLRLPFGEKSSLTEFLAALRGTRLEIRSGTTVITGRLLSVERKTRIAGGTTLEVDYISLITDSGELRTTELSPSFSVRLLEPGLAGKIDRLLDLVSSVREADTRRMVISTAGSGERSVFVSYISEVPVWKATYRIVLSAKAGQQPLLQGWAIVDNTVGQDWENVQLSLVAGAPQSFIQNLSQPYYSRRPVVPLPENFSVAPQTHESTLIPGWARLTGVVSDPTGAVIAGALVKAYDSTGELAGETRTDPSGTYGFQSLPDGAIRLEVESSGFRRTTITGVTSAAGKSSRQNATLQVGAINQSVTVTAASPEVQTESSSTATARTTGSGRTLGRGTGLVQRSGVGSGGGGGVVPGEGGGVGGGAYRVEAAATAQELGDLFEYKLKEPITIQKNRSALVPIVQSSIAAEKVSIWNDQAGLPRPQRALWLANSSGLTLDGGTFSVMEEETFAGEGIFEPIRPGEKRLVSYAMDLALNASSRQGSEQQRVTRVRVIRGVMTHVSEMRETKTYTFRNEDTSPRMVVVEHAARQGYQLRGEPQPVETTAGWMRFRVQVDPKQTAALVIHEARALETTYALTNLSSQQVDLFVRQQSINKTVEDGLRGILAQKSVISDLESKKSAQESEMQEIFDDQQRLRENMKALRGSAEEKALLQRYTQQLNGQENHLETLRKESQRLEKQQESAQAELERLVQDLSFDVKL